MPLKSDYKISAKSASPTYGNIQQTPPVLGIYTPADRWVHRIIV